MFDASLHVDVIGRFHSRGSATPPVFPDIVAAFALLRRSVINLLISWHYSTTLDFDLSPCAVTLSWCAPYMYPRDRILLKFISVDSA